MKRRTFDTLMTTGGAVVVVVLVIAGALLFVGYNFANDNVTQQLTAQKITFPEAGSESLKDPKVAPFLTKYAGQPLTTGAQAEAYANHFIAVHVAEASDGKTYAELGGVQGGLRAQIADAKAKNDPGVAALEAKLAQVTQTRDTVFKGETLRGLLLNAYAFWKIGQIAKIAMIASFALAGVMGVLTILGFVHLRRVTDTEEIFAHARHAQPAGA